MTDDNPDQQLKTVEEKLSELLYNSSNLSPLQQQLLTNVLNVLSSTSKKVVTTIAELHHKHQELAHQLEQEQVVNAIAQHIHQCSHPQHILTTAAADIQQCFQADRVIIYRFTADGGAIAVAESVSAQSYSILNKHEANEAQMPQEMAFRLCLLGAYTIDDPQHKALSPDLLQVLMQQQVKAMLSAQLFHQKQGLGFIAIHQCLENRQWHLLEVDLLQQIASHVAIALHQSELYQQAQQRNLDLEKQILNTTNQLQNALKFESMLKRITDKVRDSLDENQILQTVVQELTLVLGLGGCNAAIYNLEQGTSTICYEHTNSIPAYQGRVVHMEHFPEIYGQLKQGYSFQFCSLTPNPARGPVTMLACAIFVDPGSSEGSDRAVLGDLWLIHHEGCVFNEFEVRLAQQVANQCAIAIRQARLYQAAQVQVQELEKLNRLKDEFLSTVSHELRTPITNVKMAIHMLKIAPTEERRQRCLSILESETAREAELIDELLDLQRLEAASHPVVLELTRLQDWLPEVVEPFRSRIAEQQQTLEVNYPDDLPPLVTDVIILRRILSELLNNACKYTPEGNAIILKVSSAPRANDEKADSETVFVVQNRADISATELPHIFEKFYRVIQVDRYKQGGTGLGLALVQKRIEQLCGTITAESIDGWTTFTVRLPLLQVPKTEIIAKPM